MFLCSCSFLQRQRNADEETNRVLSFFSFPSKNLLIMRFPSKNLFIMSCFLYRITVLCHQLVLIPKALLVIPSKSRSHFVLFHLIGLAVPFHLTNKMIYRQQTFCVSVRQLCGLEISEDIIVDLRYHEENYRNELACLTFACGGILNIASTLPRYTSKLLGVFHCSRYVTFSQAK